MTRPQKRTISKGIDPILAIRSKIEKLEDEIVELKKENKQLGDLIKLSTRSATSFKIELQRLTTRMNTNESNIRHLRIKR